MSNEETILRNIMAMIYGDGHWANQAAKFDEILMYIQEELSRIGETK